MVPLRALAVGNIVIKWRASRAGGLQGALYGSSAIAADLFMLGVTPLVDASIIYAGAMALFPRLKRHTEKLHEDRGREVRDGFSGVSGFCSSWHSSGNYLQPQWMLREGACRRCPELT